MSEDLRKRLEFKNRGVRNAAIEKIKSQIIKGLAKAKNEGLVEAKSKKIAELELLWDQCHIETVHVSHACCSALTSLVLTSHLDLDEVLRGFLNLYPSAANVAGIAKGITDLLVMQTRAVVHVKRSSKLGYTNPYKIRSHPHPLITCLMSRPNNWPVILHQVEYLLSLTDKSIRPYIIPMLEPFLKYLFLEPGQSLEYAGLRAALYNGLLQQCSMESPNDEGVLSETIINFFIKCIPALQISLPQHMAEVTTFISQFTNILLTTQNDKQRPLCQQLSTYIAALCLHARRSGLDTSHLLSILRALTMGNLLPESTLVLIGWLILEANSLKELSILLDFVEGSLSQTKKPIRLFFIFPLVQTISSPPVSPSIYGDLSSRIQKKATYCLSLIKKNQSEDRNYGMDSLKCEVHTENQCGISVCPSYIDINTYTHLLLVLHDNKMAVHEWLSVIQSKLSYAKSVSEYVMMVVASLLMRRDEDQIDGCLGTLLAIAKLDPSKAPSILSLLLYLLGVEERPSVTLKVVNTVPQTATHRYCIAPVLKVIHSLGANMDMCAVSIRLLTALWKLQDRCFPHLQKMITVENFQETQCKPFEYNEELLAKTASIKDICKTRPFQHGADLVHSLSTILNDYTEECHAIPASFALEGLSALCEAEVVDIRSTWNLLAPKLRQDQRTLVQIHLCKLFSLVPSLAVDTDEYEAQDAYSLLYPVFPKS